MNQITSCRPTHPSAGITRHRARPIARRATLASSRRVRVSTLMSARDEGRCERRECPAPQLFHAPYAAVSLCGYLRVAEGPPPQFAVSCKQCGRQLMSVDRIRDPEIAVLVDHLRACTPIRTARRHADAGRRDEPRSGCSSGQAHGRGIQVARHCSALRVWKDGGDLHPPVFRDRGRLSKLGNSRLSMPIRSIVAISPAGAHEPSGAYPRPRPRGPRS